MEKEQLVQLYQLCKSSCILIDWVAARIAKISFEPKEDNLNLAAECLVNLNDINTRIWQSYPDLKPYHLKKRNMKNKTEITYGPDNPIPEGLRIKLKIQQAIELLEGLSASDNEFIRDVANQNISLLTGKLNDT